MNIYIRKSLLFISYTAFVIIAPLVILYAVGYRPQASSPIPRSVGVILADAVPSQATVSVNGIQHNTVPRSIPNVEPGIATVRIEKDGYTPWEKNLEVKPTQATDVRSVRLLPSSFEKELLTQNVSLFAKSPNSLLYGTVSKENTLRILDDEGLLLFPEVQLGASPTALSWSPDSSQILITMPKHTYQLIRLQGAVLVKVPAVALTGISDIRWSHVATDTLYGLDTARSLISYIVSTATNETLIRNVNTYEIANRTIYYQSFENALVAHNMRSGDEDVLIEDTGKAIQGISATNSGTLALHFADGELILLRTNGEQVAISPVARSMEWSPNQQLLLVQTASSELAVYNDENERLFAVPLRQLHPITRLSSPIAYPQWFPDSMHIFYQADNTLYFSEIDTRDHPIALPIDTTMHAVPIALGEESKSIIYMQKSDTNARLVRTWLLTPEDR